MIGYRCNTCDGTSRWLSTLEDGPETLIDLGPCPEGCPEPSRRPPRWLSFVEWSDCHDIDLPYLSTKGYALGVYAPRIDKRDAIVGGTWHPAPPDQQYGFRVESWLRMSFNRDKVALHLGCTGHFLPSGHLSHDGDTCPIHEADSPEEPF